MMAAYDLGAEGAQASSAVPHLIQALQDTDADVRAAAAEALGDIGQKGEVIEALKTLATHDKEEAVQKAARKALGKLTGISKEEEDT